MSEGHARLGPSNHRWPNCPGSVREEAGYPDVAGEAAIDGTGSHLLLELCLTNGVRAEQYEGQIIGANHPDNPMGWLVSSDRIERVQMCLDYVSRRVQELREQFGGEVSVESESISDPGVFFGRTDWHGTADITIEAFDANGNIMLVEIVDFKDGRGWVHVPGNTQLVSYIAGKVLPWLVDDIKVQCRMTIVQPKTNPVVRYEETDSVDVKKEAKILAMAANRTDSEDAPLIPDDKGGKGYCRWCKHKSNCTALASKSLTTVSTMTNLSKGSDLFSIIQQSTEMITALTEEQLSELADAREGILAIFDRVHKEMETRIASGKVVPGYGMVPGKGSNVWSEDEEKIAKMLKARKLKKEEIYPAKLISPAQVMKLKNLTKEQKERIQKEYITYTAGDSKLGKVARESQQQSIENMFKDVAQGTTDVVQSTPEISFI